MLNGFERVDSRLAPLSKKLLGRDERYRRGAVLLRISVGLDVEDELDDMDMDGYDTRRHDRTLRLLGGGVVRDMRLVSWTEPGVSDACSSVTIVSVGLSTSALLAVVDGVRLDTAGA